MLFSYGFTIASMLWLQPILLAVVCILLGGVFYLKREDIDFKDLFQSFFLDESVKEEKFSIG